MSVSAGTACKGSYAGNAKDMKLPNRLKPAVVQQGRGSTCRHSPRVTGSSAVKVFRRRIPAGSVVSRRPGRLKLKG